MNISFLESELADVDFRQQEQISGCFGQQTAGGDVVMHEDEDVNLLQMSMCKINSRTSLINESKFTNATHLKSQYESEVTELRNQITGLETKNKKYLEIIGMTASENQQYINQNREAAQDAVNFTKRAKEQGASEQDMQILEELEEMLETQQKEMATY